MATAEVFTDSPPRFLAYLRQSITKTEVDDSLSLIGQERAIRQLIAQRGGVLIEPPIIDADERGWDPDRPGIAALIERTRTERPDAIAIYAVSRLARDAWYAEGLWRHLLKLQPALELCSVTEPQANDDFVRGIFSLVSELDRKRMSVFLTNAFESAARRGEAHGKAPYGFVKGDDKHLVINTTQAEIVREMVTRALDGWSLTRLARWLTADGVPGPTWDTSVVKHILTNPALAGGVRYREDIYWDAHPGIISRIDFDALTTQLATRPTIRTKAHGSWLEGIIRCGCGAPMHLIQRANKVPNRDAFYGQFRCAANPCYAPYQRRNLPPCTFSPRSISRTKAEAAAVAAVISDLERVLTAEQIVRIRQETYVREEAATVKRKAKLDREREKIEREFERIILAYKHSVLTLDELSAERKGTDARLAAIDAELATLPQPPDEAEIAALVTPLITARAVLTEETANHADGMRRFLVGIGATVVRDPVGVHIVWPDALVSQGVFHVE